MYILPDVIQCYKCWGFNHFSDRCNKTEVCGKCGSTSHKTRECDAITFKCINCTRLNISDNNHPAYSHKCPCLNKFH